MKKMTFQIDFASKFKFFSLLSLLLFAATLVLFVTKGLNYGVDFRGGAEVQVQFKKTLAADDLRSSLSSLSQPISSLQSIEIAGTQGSAYLIKLQNTQDLNLASQELTQKLAAIYGEGGFEILKNDIVGPKAGKELRLSAFQAMVWAMLAIMIYVALRFDYKYSPGAIVALIHDVMVIILVFLLTQKEFSLQIVAAILAIIGYSVNDTVVIYDRVREIENAEPHKPITTVINQAMNETFSRTILTALTTFIVTMIMYVMGGGVIHDFFLALNIGVVAGTYSTIYIASPVTVLMDRWFKARNQSSVVQVKA
jgi:preprotein translocase subunit SecF